jgi:DNA-directed RNA polymerase subunit RPC12/RpoP
MEAESMKYAVFCAFCGRKFYIAEEPELDVEYICPDCMEEWEKEV